MKKREGIFLTVMKERAINMISRMPEERLYYVVQLLESVERLSEYSEDSAKGFETPEQRALKNLQRFRKQSDVEIDYKAELAKARKN